MNPISTINPFLGKKVLVVTAHPDDESPLAAGTLFQILQSGGQVYLLCATHGERGMAHVEFTLTTEELAATRREELRIASEVIGLKGVEVLSFPDGDLESFIEPLKSIISDRASEFDPDVIMGFGPDGITKHRDHIAAYAAAFTIAQQKRLPYAAFTLPPLPIRLKYVEVLEKKRKFGLYTECEELKMPTVGLSVNKEIKLKAIHAHKTQLAGLDPYIIFDPELAEHVVSYEYFHF